MPKGKLSKRQAAIYEYICSYTDQHGYPPSAHDQIGNPGYASLISIIA